MEEKQKNMTQKDLTDIAGINQGDISRLENRSANPSLNTIKRLTNGLGLTLKLEFFPSNKV